MGEVKEFKPRGGGKPPVKPADPHKELFDSLGETMALVEAGTITMVVVGVSGPEGARHLVYERDESSVADAAQVLLALRLAGDQIAARITQDSCCQCGAKLTEEDD